MVQYYQQEFPKYDLHNGEMIKFKNKNQYFNTEFNSRINLKAWLKSKPEEEVKKYCTELIRRRIDQKGIKYSLSQVEIRTLLIPPIQYYDKCFGNYYQFCETLGLKNKYSPAVKIIEEEKWKNQEYKIFIDTREQKPLKFKDRETETVTLKFGDYSFSSKEATCNCYIERKNLSDFIGTLSGGYDRFVNEIKRAVEAKAYLVVLVEDTLPNALSFQYLPHISKKIQVTPDYIFHKVRSLIQEYSNLQFLFVAGRVEASRVVEKIFTSGCVHETIDLQYAYDIGVL